MFRQVHINNVYGFTYLPILRLDAKCDFFLNYLPIPIYLLAYPIIGFGISGLYLNFDDALTLL